MCFFFFPSQKEKKNQNSVQAKTTKVAGAVKVSTNAQEATKMYTFSTFFKTRVIKM